MAIALALTVAFVLLSPAGQELTDSAFSEPTTRSHAPASAVEGDLQQNLINREIDNSSGLTQGNESIKSLGLDIQLQDANNNDVSSWQLALVNSSSEEIVYGIATSSETGEVSFPSRYSGDYWLEGVHPRHSAVRTALSLHGEDDIKIVLSLGAATELSFVDSATGNPVAGVACLLNDSDLLVGESDLQGIATLQLQKSALRFEKKGYAASYVYDGHGGERDVIIMRKEISVTIALSSHWSQYPGDAHFILEQPLRPGIEVVDYMRFKLNKKMSDTAQEIVSVPQGSELSLSVFKGQALKQMSTEPLQDGQTIVVPAPQAQEALSIYLRSPQGKIVRGNLRAYHKGSAAPMPVTWVDDHWVLPTPGDCAHFEVESPQSATSWYWQDPNASIFNGTLQLQLILAASFKGNMIDSRKAHSFSTHITLTPAANNEGVRVHEGWLRKYAGAVEIDVTQSGVFQIDGLTEQTYYLSSRPTSLPVGDNIFLNEVSLPQTDIIDVLGDTRRHYRVYLFAKESGQPIPKFSATIPDIGLTTVAEAGGWEGWAEPQDAVIFRAVGYKPAPFEFPEESQKNIRLEVSADSPMTLVISGLTEEQFAEYSSLQVYVMQQVDDDFLPISFEKSFPLTSAELEIRLPAEGEWVGVSLSNGKLGGSLSSMTPPFRWLSGTRKVIQFE
ncbi:MAG: hypothetical protein H8E25_05655 [Planctomycetes bacterium]|nr:hypothetical protein [Planctomycetota bacterium]